VNNALLEFRKRYYNQPVLLVREVLGQEPDDWQAETMEAVAAGERQIAVKSGHGVGKTALLCWICIWFMLTRYPFKIQVTAPTSGQLENGFYSELKMWIKQLPPDLEVLFEVKSDTISIVASPESGFLAIRTSRIEQPEALAGVHSANVLLIADEASGVPDPVFETASGSMSDENACTILAGNPVRTTGLFYDAFHRLARYWWTKTVSCLDSPRVSDKYVQEQAIRYGEESNAFRIRVLGEFPRGDDDTVIPMELILGAQHRDLVPDTGVVPVWGLDVARFGDDKSSLVRRRGRVMTDPPMNWKGLDTAQIAGLVFAEWEGAGDRDKPGAIVIDSNGVGAGVEDRLRQLGVPVRGVNTAESPTFAPQLYMNLRSELWYGKARAWFQSRGCSIPLHGCELLVSELASPRYKFTSTNKIQIESKEDMKRRGVPSPNDADALILTFAVNEAILAGSRSRLRGQPLKRRIGGIV